MRKVINQVDGTERDELEPGEKAPVAQIPMITQADLDQVQAQKQKNLRLGAVGDALGNMQTAGNFFLRQPAPHQDVSGFAEKQNALLDEGLKNKERIQAQALKAPELHYAQESFNPDSDVSKLAGGTHAAMLAKFAGTVNDPSAKQTILTAAEKLKTMPASDQQQFLEKSGLAKILASETQASDRNLYLQNVMGQRRELAENKMHEGVMGKLQNDKQLGQRLVQYQNLDNAMSNFMKADHVTPQTVDEFQQAIRGNLGIKGSSGVGERESSYINTLGLSGDRLKQFLTGNPADVAKDSALINHLRQLAQLEQGNIHGQYQKRLGAVTAGRGFLYGARPDLKADLDNAVQSYSGQLPDMIAAEYGQGQAPAGGAPQGGGIPGVQGASAAPPKQPATSPEEDRAALEWAQDPKNANDPRARKFLLHLNSKVRR